ncbi:MAG: DUF445 family protein [Firmicutes bacterium]|nr:DUF445 family protein [Bacillota bacterium]
MDNTLILMILAAVTLIFSGTVAGYITNKYAVRWLFKPVKLFGKQIFDVSILSTEEKQQAFIDSLSDCVETRILTNDVLKAELVNDRMRRHVEDIVDRFLTEDLPENFRQIRLSEMADFRETEKGFRRYAEQMLKDHTEELLRHVLSEVRMSDYLTEGQVRIATDNFYGEMKDAYKNSYSIHDKARRVLRELAFSAMFHSDGRKLLRRFSSRLFRSREDELPDYNAFTLPEQIDPQVQDTISDNVAGRIREKSLADYLTDEQIHRLSEALQEELKKQYDLRSEDLFQENLEALITGIGKSRRVRKSASNVLYDYVTRNIHKLLNGKIRSTVSMALGRLDPEQLCDVAEMLLRGELKYLSYFGAVLGFIISIPALFLTLEAFHPAGFPQDPLMLLFLVALMAFIGVITNVIAIRMFFRPYKSIRFLAKNRHLKVFSQGLILQNQERFANKLGDYIGTELLTEDNITKMFRENRGLFTDVIRKGALSYVHEYFQSENNRSKIASKLSALAFNTMAENADKISARIVDYAIDRPLCSFVDLNKPDTALKARNMYYSMLDKLTEPGLVPVDSPEDQRFMLCTAAGLIKDSPKITENVWDLLETFYLTRLSDATLQDYISVPLLKDSVERTLTAIVRNDAAFHSFRSALHSCIRVLADNAGLVIGEHFLNVSAHRVATAAFDTVLSEVPSLLEDIHFAEITREKVSSLGPAEIEGIVRSFANPVFRKLYALGCIGAIFGLNTYLAFVFLIIDKIRE